MLSELDVLRDVGARLEGAGIPYMLTGSMAMNYYATPRMTRDIDLVVALSAADSALIRSLFEPAYYVPDNLEQAIASIGIFNLVHVESVIKVDIIVRKNEDYRRAEFERRMAVDLEGARIWLVSKEDLILSKLLWAKQSASEMQRRDVQNLLATGADRFYLRFWAERLGVAPMLEELLHD